MSLKTLQLLFGCLQILVFLIFLIFEKLLYYFYLI